MKAKVLVGILAVASVIAVTTAIADTTTEVYALKFRGAVLQQDVKQGEPAVYKARFSEDAIVNLTRGRAIDATPVATEKLALKVNWATREAKVIVFDTVNKVPLATIAVSRDCCLVESDKRAQMSMPLDIQRTGITGNRVNGGNLSLIGSSKKDAAGHASQINAKVTGDIHWTEVVDGKESSYEALMSNTTLHMGAKLATLVE
jgi:hypothetical protein